MEKGIEAGLQFFADAKGSEGYYLREGEMNDVGYALMRAGLVNQAIEVFKLNVELFPNSANAYDSLGEAYLTASNEPLARENYEKSVKLNPDNSLAISILKRLSSDDPQRVTDEEIGNVVDSIANLVEEYYVSLEVGKEISAFIKTKNGKGDYRGITDPKELARQLTIDLRATNGDLHMFVGHRPIGAAVKNKDSLSQVNKSGSWTNYGFQELKILDGNVGYLKIQHFTSWEYFDDAKKAVTNSMGALANSDALIVDVRDNGGGFEEMVAWLSSYFHDDGPIHLADYYRRYSDERVGIYTTKDVPGTKITKIPIYILVNAKTGSAAESFAFSMKNLKRAVVIGETTMGAGYGAMNHRVNDRFTVNISSETMLNPVSNAGIEQVGVQPDVAVPSDKAFAAGYRLALEKLKLVNEGKIHPSNYDAILNTLK